MMLRLVLRGLAVLIAVLGAIDPAITLERRNRAPLIVAVDDARPAALISAARLQELLTDDFDVRLRSASSTSARLPLCGADESCVLVGGERWPHAVADARARVLGAIRVEAHAGARVTIADVAAPATTHASAVGRLRVDLEGRGMAGQESAIEVFDGDVPVGHALHRWEADGTATVPVEWWPFTTGLRRLSVRVSPAAARHEQTSDRVEVGVDVTTAPYNVLVFDTRPSWMSTFVRRAIEKDTRVAVRVVAGLGPRLQVSEGAPFRFDEATLTEASTVIIGAADDLSVREVDLLERFVRVRGGSLVLVPDRRPTGPLARLLPSPNVERLEPSPVQVGEWRATELLLFPDAGPHLAVLAKAGDAAAVLSAATGNGRILVSGAMDAWRYRDSDGGRFDRAWRSLIAQITQAGGRPLEIVLDRSAARPGDEVRATVRLRLMAPPDATVAVGATIACGGEPPRPLRLWPTGDRRRFAARFAPGAPGRCDVAVSSTAPITATAAAGLLVSEDLDSRRSSSTGSDPISENATKAGDELSLARDVRRAMPGKMATVDVRLMRSPWWILPFATCLGAEWWLRRRAGGR